MDNSIQAHQKELCNKLWAMANALRGNMEAYEFKNYILGMIFYYYLSDRTEKYMANLLKDDGIGYEEAWADEEYKTAVVEEALRDLGYVIEPQYLFRKMVKMVENRSFDIEFLQSAINALMESTIGNDSQEDFDGLFSDMQLDSSKLGHTVKDRSAVMAKIIASLDEINFGVDDTKIDVLGNAYEYLIGQFASETGKKAGEFYTPHGPAQILCRIAMTGQENKKGLQVYDPCMGSGSLMLSCRNYSTEPDFIKYYGQELMPSTYNLARMDERFMDYGGKLAPKSKADYAFLLHGFYHLKQTGTMAIVLPHGVLFRGAAEGSIRKTLLENGSIYAVIGLPSNMFYNTSIPTCIIVLKKHREGRDVLFIDASKLFEKEKKQNVMKEEHIDHVLELYNNRKTVEKEAYLASYDDIVANDFNLNIPRYVDTTEEEEEIDLNALTQSMRETDKQIKEENAALVGMMKELTFQDDATKEAVEAFIRVLEEV